MEIAARSAAPGRPPPLTEPRAELVADERGESDVRDRDAVPQREMRI